MNYGSLRRIDFFFNKCMNLACVRTVSHIFPEIKIRKNKKLIQS